MNAVLLFNPSAGRDRQRRADIVRNAADILTQAGFQVQVEATQGPGKASRQAADAVRRGAEVIFACGGDGTMHEVLQGIAGTKAMLAVLPAGSANALARELGVPRGLLQAAASYRPEVFVETRASSMTFEDGRIEYFLALAGAGPDGALMYRMITMDRGRWGHWLYYQAALHLFLQHSFPAFTTSYRERNGTLVNARYVSMLALRVRQLGGLFGGIARGSSLQSARLRVLLLRGPAWLSLPLWIVGGWIGLSRWNPLLKVIDGDELIIRGDMRLSLQADGEWMGRGSAQLHASAAGIRILMPVRQPTRSWRSPAEKLAWREAAVGSIL